MNVLKNGLIGLGLVAFLAGCNQTPQTSAKLEQSAKSETVAIAPEANQPAATMSKDSAAPDLSTVEVKISGQKVELSESQAQAGLLTFNVRNESVQPLNMELVKTDLSPAKIMVKDGQIDKTQSGVEVISEASDRPLKSKHEATISETLEPGEYTFIATSPSKAEPIATATIKVI